MTQLDPEGKWDAKLDLSKIPPDEARHLFRPFMTTLVELQLNREPMPLSADTKNDVSPDACSKSVMENRRLAMAEKKFVAQT